MEQLNEMATGQAAVDVIAAAMGQTDLTVLTNDEEYVTLDDGTIVNTVTGEIIGIDNAPAPIDNGLTKEVIENAALETLALWVGERRAYHQAKARGLQEEKQVWLDKIAASFDADIKRHTAAVDWIENQYHNPLYLYAQRMLEGAKKRSHSIGVMVLKLVKTRAKTEVLDSRLAVGWAVDNNLKDAIKVTVVATGQAALDLSAQFVNDENATVKTDILVSAIPNEKKAEILTTTAGMLSGLYYYPGGEEQLKID